MTLLLKIRKVAKSIGFMSLKIRNHVGLFHKGVTVQVITPTRALESLLMSFEVKEEYDYAREREEISQCYSFSMLVTTSK